DSLIGTVVTLQYVSRLQDSEAKLRSKLSEKEHKAKHRFYEILGSAPTITFAISQAQKFSQVEASVLITGKSGTGKELFAQSMHNASRRKSFPFVAINCAAIPENLLESELFGYVEGAFTGAVRGGKMGIIEMAHRGTLFLDEISELPLGLQARLLRVLQEREIRRLGHDKVINVDVRVFSATNRNLDELVSQGKFREDLYYRLDVLRLNLPSLSERREDIPILCRHYINLYAEHNKKTAPEFSREAIALLSSLPWEGNIRELCNVCQRLIVLCDTGEIGAKLVEEAINRSPQSVRSDNRQLVVSLLAQGISKSDIAARLGIERTTLWRKMKKWGLN
ncbi:MAG: sigma-54 interaction domain-containing protein, partial [Oscillospiraceae bacterium]